MKQLIKTTFYDVLKQHNIECTLAVEYNTIVINDTTYYYDSALVPNVNKVPLYEYVKVIGTHVRSYYLFNATSEQLKALNDIDFLELNGNLYIVEEC